MTISRPTMTDVAALAGVSLKTVSRVINNESSVTESTRHTVRRAADLLDYRHHSAASNLARSDPATGIIGLLLDDIGNPFSAQLHRAIEDESRLSGMLVLAGSSDKSLTHEHKLLDTFERRRVDGIILVPVGAGSDVQSLNRYGTPVVFLDRPGNLPDADTVTTNNREASRDAVRRLIANGHRRIAYLGDLNGIWTEQERFEGYLEAMRSLDVPIRSELIVRALHDSSWSEVEASRLLAYEEPPTAFFAWQNRATIGAWRALRARGLNHECALIGFDDLEFADVLDPPITVIVQDPAELGSKAASTLLARLAADTSPPRHIIVPSRLLQRGSGEIPAVGAHS